MTEYNYYFSAKEFCKVHILYIFNIWENLDLPFNSNLKYKTE